MDRIGSGMDTYCGHAGAHCTEANPSYGDMCSSQHGDSQRYICFSDSRNVYSI